MRLDNINSCETNIEATSFQIVASPKMFRILSSGLYKEKELAVARELLCNAYDAHKLAGTMDTPIEITVPSAYTPYFEVKDYGTGLTPEQITQLYTTYGASTKADSDEFIGGFGLGSKSPLCLTDQFTVETRINGKRHTFQAFIQADGAPGIALLDSSDTDEPNGLTVRVPVPNTSYQTWHSCLQRLLPFAPVPVTGAEFKPMEEAIFSKKTPDHPFIERIVITKGDSTFDGRNGYGDIVIVQGHVPYRVEFWDVQNRDPQVTNLLISGGIQIYLFTKIGTFPLTASRESFENVPQTQQRKHEILFDFLPDIAKEFFEQVTKDIKTWWDYSELVSKLNLRIDHEKVDVLKELFNKLGVKDDFYLQRGEAVDVKYLSPQSFIHRCELIKTCRYGYGYGERLSTTRIIAIRGADTTTTKFVIYAVPEGKPFKATVEQLLKARSDDIKVAYVFRGTAAEIKEKFALFGIPYDVTDLPVSKTTRTGRSAKATLQGPEREFDSYVIYDVHNLEVQLNISCNFNRMSESKLETLMNGSPDNRSILVFVPNIQPTSDVVWLRNYIAKRYAKLPKETKSVIILHVPERMTGIRRTLRKKYGEDRVFESIPEFVERFTSRRAWLAHVLSCMDVRSLLSDANVEEIEFNVINCALLRVHGLYEAALQAQKRRKGWMDLIYDIRMHTIKSPMVPYEHTKKEGYLKIQKWAEERIKKAAIKSIEPMNTLYDIHPNLKQMTGARYVHNTNDDLILAEIIESLIKGEQLREAA